MLIYGDFDCIPMQRAEEYCAARQDRRVQLVRYHGNVLDVGQRIDAWLGDLLGRPKE